MLSKRMLRFSWGLLTCLHLKIKGYHYMLPKFTAVFKALHNAQQGETLAAKLRAHILMCVFLAFV